MERSFEQMSQTPSKHLSCSRQWRRKSRVWGVDLALLLHPASPPGLGQETGCVSVGGLIIGSVPLGGEVAGVGGRGG